MRRERERKAQEEVSDLAKAKKIKEREEEERKRKLIQEDQSRKLQDAHLKNKDEAEKLKRDDIVR
jgi:hypothetical protein